MNDCLGLIRHARTPWNRERRIQGRVDIPLDRQAEAEAVDMAAALAGQDFEQIIASPLARTARTAEILSQYLNLPLSLDKGIIEADFGTWEGRTFKGIAREDPKALAPDRVAGWRFRPPGGESRQEVLSRAQAAVTGMVSRFPGQKILVVTHKTLIKILVYQALNREFKWRTTEGLSSGRLHLLATDMSWARPNHLRLLPLEKEAK